jgi:flagellar hook protein FlgE
MRLESAFRASREGLTAHGQAISVIGDNIANANTTAFKRQRAEFTALLSDRVNDRGSEVVAGVGDGVALGRVRVNFESGPSLVTGRELDVAVSGRGFFLVGDPDAPTLTRAGNFQIGENGLLETSEGLPVLGYSGIDNEVLGTINLRDLDAQPLPTNGMQIFGNVEAASNLTTPPVNALTFPEISGAANFIATQSVYDTAGDRHDIQFAFFKTDVNQWSVQAYINGTDVGQEENQPVLLGEATLAFNAFGQIAEENAAQATLELNPAWANGAAQNPITVLLGEFSQFAGGNRVTNVTQDGRGNGEVVSYEVSDDGAIFGVMDTGLSIQAGSLALGLVTSTEGLARDGANNYTVTAEAGALEIERARVAGRGVIQNGALESSNVDLPEQFSDMIIIQRGYQANSQVLSAASDLLKSTIAMVR